MRSGQASLGMALALACGLLMGYYAALIKGTVVKEDLRVLAKETLAMFSARDLALAGLADEIKKLQDINAAKVNKKPSS